MLPEKRKPRSRIYCFVHLVWATHRRHPWLVDTVENAIYRTIGLEAQRARCRVFGIGGIEDHVHVLLLMPATIAIAEIVKPMKTTSSLMASDLLGDCQSWQDNYAAFSVSRGDLKKVRTISRARKSAMPAGACGVPSRKLTTPTTTKKSRAKCFTNNRVSARTPGPKARMPEVKPLELIDRRIDLRHPGLWPRCPRGHSIN